MRMTCMIVLLLVPMLGRSAPLPGDRGSPGSGSGEMEESKDPQCIVAMATFPLIDTDCEGELEALEDLKDLPVHPKASSTTALGTQNMADLILSRGAAIFDIENQDLSKLHICEGHKDYLVQNKPYDKPLSRKIRRGKDRKTEHYFNCAIKARLGVLDHGEEKVETDGEYVSKEGSAAIAKYTRNFIPVGTPICDEHQTELDVLVDKYRKKERGSTASGGSYVPSQGQASSAGRGEAMETVQESAFQEIIPLAKTKVRELSELLQARVYTMVLDWPEASTMQKERKARQFTRFIRQLSKVLHKERYGNEALDYVVRRFMKRADVKAEDPKLTKLLTNIADMFASAATPTEKRRALSLVASDLPYSLLARHIPNLSHYYFGEARRFKDLYGPGGFVRPRKITRRRWSPEKVRSFVAFLTAPTSGIVQDLPFGMETVHFDDGRKLEISKLYRTMDASLIIYNYEIFLRENGARDLALSHSTYRAILKRCRSSQRHSAKGLDYFTYEALEAFDDIRLRVLHKLPIVPSSRADSMTESLTLDASAAEEWEGLWRLAKNYLRVNYKLHTRLASRVPQHCIHYALSDASNPNFSQACVDHQHDSSCDDCNNVNRLFRDLSDYIFAENSPDERHKLEFITNSAKRAVFTFQAHQLRTVNQERAKSDILANMGYDEDALIIVDWAMKYLPSKGRETQQEFFGKRGVSWLVATVILRFDELATEDLTWTDGIKVEYMERSYIYVLQSESSQDGAAVAAILDDLVGRLKSNILLLKRVFFRSDKAECFHNLRLFRSLAEMEVKHNVKIARWDFSEPQSGKSSCDRTAARAKLAVSRAIDQGHSCWLAQEFFECMGIHIGMKSTVLVLGDVQAPKNPTPKYTIKGISNLNNFAWEDEGLRVWRAYGVGNGEYHPFSDWGNAYYRHTFKVARRPGRNEHEAVIYENLYEADAKISPDGWEHDHYPGVWQYWKPIDVKLSAKAKDRLEEESLTLHREHRAELDLAEADWECPAESTSRACSPLSRAEELEASNVFRCPEPGCTAVYASQGRLDGHWHVGNHRFKIDQTSLLDFALNEYIQNIESQGLEPLPLHGEGIIRLNIERGPSDSFETPEKGWALFKAKPSTRFTDAQKKFVHDLFWEGEISRKKVNPATAALLMREQFPPELWLKESQIQSIFSKLASEVRKRGLKESDAAEAENLALQQVDWRGNDEMDREEMDASIEENIIEDAMAEALLIEGHPE